MKATSASPTNWKSRSSCEISPVEDAVVGKRCDGKKMLKKKERKRNKEADSHIPEWLDLRDRGPTLPRTPVWQHRIPKISPKAIEEKDTKQFTVKIEKIMCHIW
eukprot:GHVU01135569.1.p3 GENE.GHVU01135569.1~~GHVU01135569.1.p3  ORF type:complete len:104 (+),score=15.84 GHVU01135569.1:501-812(+)